ncbi:hypothetical protein AB1484_31365 [Parafrankia sp. FMc6]|uniref:hypothetical protein n=1 Tax=Parafrankia soli TaxID=2599596 RepID=UPI0034D56893
MRSGAAAWGALRRRAVFAVPSKRWADPRAQLLDGADWQAVREFWHPTPTRRRRLPRIVTRQDPIGV